MNSQDFRYAVDVVNAGSELVTLERIEESLGDTVAGTSRSGRLVDGGGALVPMDTLVDSAHNQLRVSVYGSTPVAVTLNPAMDFTVTLGRLEPGEVNRARGAEMRPAGKGVNVSAMHAVLGQRSAATGLMPRLDADAYARYLAGMGVEDAFHRVPGRARINVKLVESGDGRVTDVNTPGPEAPANALEGVLARLDAMPSTTALHIPRCRSVHTFTMRFPLDLIWLDKAGHVVRVDPQVPPRRLKSCLRARSVIEARGGTADAFLAAGLAAAVLLEATAAGQGDREIEMERRAAQYGAMEDAMLLGFYDLPALRSAELRSALQATPATGASFVADALGTGTTLYAARDPADFMPAFGARSADRHRAAGAVALTGDWPSLRQDVDEIGDLGRALILGVGEHTRNATGR